MMEKYSGPIEKVESVEKVKLTYEQAEAIEIYKALRYTIETFVNTKQSFGMSFKSLKSLSVDDFASALLTGYEIEPEQPKFQQGDKIVNDDGTPIAEKKMIATYAGQNHIGIHFLEEFAGAFMGPKFRKATPEEIYWLETLGRDFVGDFQIGDCYEYKIGGKILEVDNHERIQRVKVLYKKGILEGIYPVESFKPFPAVSENE